MHLIHAVPSRNVAGLLFASLTFAGTSTRTPGHIPHDPAAVTAKMSEWKITLSQETIPAGTVAFTATNAGTIPHAFEVEGQGMEKKTDVIQPGSSATITLTLKPGTYEVYCPVGEDSHKKLGMVTHLRVVRATGSAPSGYSASRSTSGPSATDASMSNTAMQDHAMSEPSTSARPKIQAIKVTGGGPVIQILPGPFPFPDSAARVLQAVRRRARRTRVPGEERSLLEQRDSDLGDVQRSRPGTRARCVTR